MTQEPERALRVLAYCDSRQYSGAEAFFVRVANDLAGQTGVHVIPAAPSRNRMLVAALEAAAGRRVVPIPSQPHRLSAFHLFDRSLRRAASQALREEPYDVLFCNLSSAEHGHLALFTPEGRGHPSVGLLHLHHRPITFGNRFGRTRERLARIGTRRLDVLCVLSSTAAELSARRWAGAGSDVRVVPMPLPAVTRRSKPVARASFGMDATATVVGFAGRLNFRQKGLDTFIETASRIAGDLDDATFVVAGEGDDGAEAQDRVARLGLSERFHFLGRVEDMGSLLSALDLVIIPSRIEGVPLVSLEAVLVGTPGAACAVDGLVDVWPEQWQVPPGDAAGLASVARDILAADEATNDTIIATARAGIATTVSDDLGPAFRNALEHARTRP